MDLVQPLHTDKRLGTGARKILVQRLKTKRDSMQVAAQEFNDLVSNLPTGIPAPDSSLRIHQAKEDWARAMKEYQCAQDQWLDFIVHGVIPIDLQGREQ